jgi:hypothetical protein
MSAGVPTIHEVHDSKFSLSGGLEVLTSIYDKHIYHAWCTQHVDVKSLQMAKFKGHNSSKNLSIATIFELNL